MEEKTQLKPEKAPTALQKSVNCLSNNLGKLMKEVDFAQHLCDMLIHDQFDVFGDTRLNEELPSGLAVALEELTTRFHNELEKLTKKHRTLEVMLNDSLKAKVAETARA